MYAKAMIAALFALSLAAPVALAADTAAQSNAAAPPGEVRREETAPGPKSAAPREESSARAATDAPRAQAGRAGEFRFQFDGLPYTDVVRWFAQASGKPLIADLAIEGALTFFDSQPYTYEEALDTLNLILGMRGVTLMEAGRFLRLVPLQDVERMPIAIHHGTGPIEGVRPGEFVTVVLPLRFVDGPTVAALIKPMISTAGRIGALPSGKGLILTDRLEAIGRVRGLISELDTETVIDKQMRAYRLDHASAGDAAGVLRTLFAAPRRREDKPSEADALAVTHDARTNMLVLVGPPDRLALAEQIIEQLDTGEEPAAPTMRIFDLAHAKAEDLVHTVQSLLPTQEVRDERGKVIGRTTEGRIVADAATNRLIVSAEVDVMADVAKLIEKLDEAGAEAGTVRLFVLRFADPEQLAPVLTSATARLDRGRKPEPTLIVCPEPRSRRLVVSGPTDQVETAARLIEALDAEPGQTAREVHVVAMKAGDVRQLAAALVQLFREQPGDRRGGTADRLQVAAEPATNSLIVSAAPGDWPDIERLLKELEAAAAPTVAAATRLVPLENARAEEVAAALNQVYARRAAAPLPGRPVVPVVIAASRQANSLLVSAADDDLRTIGELVKAMDVPKSEAVAPLRLVQLASADAAQLAETLRGMVKPAEQGGLVWIQADPRSNTVLLRAPEAERTMLEEVLGRLDEATRLEARETRLVGLEHASAAALAPVLSRLFAADARRAAEREGRRPPGSASEVVIAATPDDGALILGGPRAQVEQIAQLITTLDTAEAMPVGQVRTYRLTAGKAAEVAPALGRLFAQKHQAVSGSKEPAPRFEADATTNHLMVAATVPQFETIDRLIKELEAVTVLTSQTKTYDLTHAKAAQVAAVLVPMLATEPVPGGRPAPQGAASERATRVAAMERTNTLIIQGPPEKIALADDLVRTLDREEASAETTVQIVGLKQAQAASLAQAVRAALAEEVLGRPPTPGGSVPAGAAVTVTPEPNSNSILVRGPAGKVPEVVAMIERLDAGGTSATVEVRTYPLENGQATDLAASLGKLFQDMIRQQSAARRDVPPPPFSLAADDRTNSLVVSTTPSYFALVEGLLKMLDQAPERALCDVHYVWLENADASQVADSLTAMYVDRRGVDKPVIEADTYANALTIIAKPDDLAAMEPIITKLEGTARETSFQVRVIPLTAMKADKMAEVVRNVYQQMTDAEVVVTEGADESEAGAGLLRAPAEEADPEEGESRGRLFQAPREPRVTIGVDRRANALIVSGNRRDLEHIESLVEQLTASAAAEEAEFRVFKIAKADPSSVAATLDELFNPKPPPKPKDPKAPQPPVPPPVITAVPDPATRTLIIRAKPLDFDVIEPLIEQLDRVPDVATEVRIFTLKNTDAAAAAANLRDLFLLSPKPPTQKAQGEQQKEETNTPQDRRTMALHGDGGVAHVDASHLVSITANRQTNSVIVAAPSDTMVLIARIIQELDQSAALAGAASIRLYPLEHAKVKPTIAALKEVFAPKTGEKAPGKGAGGVDIVISGDEAARLVIVSAPEDAHELVARVVRDLDEAQAAGALIVRVYRVEHSEATTVAPALAETLGAKDAPGEALRISADRSSNSLVVRAAPDEHERIAALVAEMDRPAAEAFPVQLIPLRNADPAGLAEMLRRTFADAPGERGADRPATGVVIEADRASRMLMVRADEETFQKVRQLVAELDATSPAGETTQTVIPLAHADATNVAAALSQAFAAPRGRPVGPEDRVIVVGEPVSGSLIVTANEQNLAKIRSLLETLDTETAEGAGTELMLLENAKATDLAQVLSRVAGAAGARPPAPGQPPVPEAVVTADAASNALVMSGPPGALERLMAMAKQLDQASATAEAGVYVIPLESGDAAEVARMIQRLYQQQYWSARRAGQTADTLAVSADDRANAVILAASKEMYEQVLAWVTEVEQMKPALGQPRVIRLECADPAEVERAIRELFGNARVPPGGPPGRSAGGGRGRGRVETAVLEKLRSVLVTASDAEYEAARKLAETLDAAAAQAKRHVRVFTLANATNTRVAAALQSMYQAMARSEAPEEQVTVTALAQTNAVVVAAAEEMMEEVEHLIRQLDSQEISPQVEFRIFRLEHAMPTRILPALRQMLLEIQRVRPDERIDVQADERTGSIIVTARATLFDQVETLIRTLDQVPAYAEADVMLMPLKQADATRLAEVLTDMLRPSSQDQVTPEARALQEQVRRLRLRTKEGKELPELDLTKPIKIVADPRQPNQQGSNSLLVSSTPDNLKALAAIVEVMDRVPVGEGVRVRILHLEHADAESVMGVLREIFSQGRRLGGRPGTSVEGRAEPETSSGRALVNPLNISADSRTNTLVLSGLEESIALAELVVHDLDRDPGKVVTEVQLFRLNHAEASRLAPVLQSVFTENPPTPGTEGLRTQVTRLRTVLTEGEGHATELPKARAALTIQADPSTNILIVAARSDVMPLIVDVIRTMDIPGAGSLNTVRIFPLVNADASRLKEVLDGLYGGPNAALVRQEDKPTVVVDARTNALVVSANEKTFAMLGMLLQRLDAKTPIELRDIRLVRLENAEAASLASTLQQMMDARVQRQTSLGVGDAEALRVIVVADSRTNSLIVGGSAEGHRIVKDLALQLDTASPALAGQIQLIALMEANAGSLSAMLGDLFERRYAAAPTPDLQRQKPIILPDLRTNSLLVAATADDTRVLKGLLEKLDVKLVDPAVQLVVIPLAFNDAGTIGPTIQQIFQARLTSMTPPGAQPAPQDRVDVAPEPLSNALVISASKENVALIRSLLEKVDVEPPAETGIVRLYPLENADAQRVATMLQSLVSQGLYKPGLAAAGDNARLQARERVSIAVDVRTNVLIVSASRENFAVLEEIIRRIDAADEFGFLGDCRLYTLTHADATRLAPTLQRFFDAKRAAEQTTGASGRALAVSFTADARTNTLLVAGSRESFAAVEAMLMQLDARGIGAATEFRVFHLEQATASSLQPTLQQLFAQRITRGEAKDTVTVIADARSNALIVGASPADMPLAESLIAQLDVEPEAPGATVQVHLLTKADAGQVATSLRNLYEGETGVGISVDERINAIIISAGAADQKRIADLVKRLDTDSLPQVTEIRVFSLGNADAEQLAQILTDALTNKPKPMTATSPNRQTLLQFITCTRDGRELVASALQEGVLITPDRRSNALVVSAPMENMQLLESLVEALDTATPRMAEIRVFMLENADASQMAEVLRELFTLEAGGDDGTRSVNYTLMAGAPVGDEPLASATLGTADQYALSVTVDVRTNSLLIGGTTHYVELCSRIIEELDASPAQERLTEVYRLRNAQAENIQTALRTFLDQERVRLVEALGVDRLGAAHRLLEREVAVVAEPNSNTLLLSASPRYFRTVADMIRELDAPPPQVLIQVLLAEVQLDDTTDFGMDWNYTDIFDTGKVVSAGTDFGMQAVFETDGGFGVAITGGHLTYFLRALQEQGRLEVLSRPQILAADNQNARINVGQRVPFITYSRITEEGTTLNTIAYEDVGIILDVTPRISPDGFVKLQVKPEISSLSDSRVQISEGVNAIIVNTRTAETTVNVQDGHTIIIGGLITTVDNDREQKVPLLGDIPLLGALFRAKHLVKERTELLIILTPTVLRNVPDADATTTDELNRLNLLRGMTRDKEKGELIDPMGLLVPAERRQPASRPPVRRIDDARILPEDILEPDERPGPGEPEGQRR